MKKEVFAASLLVVILVLSIINAEYIEDISQNVSADIKEISRLADNGEWEQAELLLENTISYWRSKEDYVHSVLSHETVDTVTDDLFEFLDYIYSQDENTVASHAELMLIHLEDVSDFEHIRISSIF